MASRVGEIGRMFKKILFPRFGTLSKWRLYFSQILKFFWSFFVYSNVKLEFFFNFLIFKNFWSFTYCNVKNGFSIHKYKILGLLVSPPITKIIYWFKIGETPNT